MSLFRVCVLVHLGSLSKVPMPNAQKIIPKLLCRNSCLSLLKGFQTLGAYRWSVCRGGILPVAIPIQSPRRNSVQTLKLIDTVVCLNNCKLSFHGSRGSSCKPYLKTLPAVRWEQENGKEKETTTQHRSFMFL